MILMDGLNDTCGEVQFNSSESAWTSMSEKCLPFYGEVIIGFCKGKPMKNCQVFQTFRLFHKIDYCTGCHDMYQASH